MMHTALPTPHRPLVSLFPAAVVWSFAARSALRAWLGLLLAGLLCGAIIALQRTLAGAA